MKIDGAWFRTLRVRFFLIVVLPLICMQGVLVLIFFTNHWRRVTAENSRAIANEVMIILEVEEDAEGDWFGDRRRNFFKAIRRHLVRDVSVAAGSLPRARLKDLPQEQAYFNSFLAKKLGAAYRFSTRWEYPFFHVFIRLQRGEILKISFESHRLFQPTTKIFLIWALGMPVMLSLIAFIFLNNQIRPIRQLAKVGQRVQNDLLAPLRIKVRGATEVRSAILSFLRLRTRMIQFINQRTALFSSVSHDLRTPLTRMRLRAELMEESAEKKAWLEEIRFMEGITNTYLSFIKGAQAASELLDLVSLINLSARQFLERFADGQATMRIHNRLQGTVVLQGQPLNLRRCFENIFSNSEKYAENIYISGYEDGKVFHLRFEDDGPGIAPLRRESLFRPFIQGQRRPSEQAAEGDSAGLGLGLSIIRDIILQHGGGLQLESSETYGGLDLRISLPLAREAA